MDCASVQLSTPTSIGNRAPGSVPAPMQNGRANIIHRHRMAILAYALVNVEYVETHDRGRSFRSFSWTFRACNRAPVIDAVIDAWCRGKLRETLGTSNLF